MSGAHIPGATTWCYLPDKLCIVHSTWPHNTIMCQCASTPVFQYPMIRYTTSCRTLQQLFVQPKKLPWTIVDLPTLEYCTNRRDSLVYIPTGNASKCSMASELPSLNLRQSSREWRWGEWETASTANGFCVFMYYYRVWCQPSHDPLLLVTTR